MQDLNKFKNEMNLSGQNVYVGHRYVPKIFGEWDNAKIYEALSIVQYQGNSFTSRQMVPAGIEITNEEYWVSTGNYNAQVENYRQEVRENTATLTQYYGEVVNARKPKDRETYTLLNERLLNLDDNLIDRGVNVKDFGVKGNGVTNDTEALQNVLNTYKKVYIPDGDYLVSTDIGLELSNDTTLEFSENARIITTASSLGSYQILKIIGKNNIKVINPTIEGDSAKHIGTTGEWGHGIVITSSTNIDLYNTTVSNCWGDGIYYGANDLVNNENIHLHGTTKIYNCGRQGISVISGVDCTIDELIVDGITRTKPSAGIDFEPNNKGEIVSNFNVGVLNVKNSLIGLNTYAIANKVSYTIDTIITENVLTPIDIKRGNTNGVSRSHGIIKIGKVHILNTLNSIPIKLYDLAYQNSPVVSIDSVVIENFNQSITDSENAVVEVGVSHTIVGVENYGQVEINSLLVKRNSTDEALTSLFFNNKTSTAIRPRDINIRDFNVLYGPKNNGVIYNGSILYDNLIGLNNGVHKTIQTMTNVYTTGGELLPSSEAAFTWVSGRSQNVGIPTSSSGICKMYRTGIKDVIVFFYANDGKNYTTVLNLNDETMTELKEIVI